MGRIRLFANACLKKKQELAASVALSQWFTGPMHELQPGQWLDPKDEAFTLGSEHDLLAHCMMSWDTA